MTPRPPVAAAPVRRRRPRRPDRRRDRRRRPAHRPGRSPSVAARRGPRCGRSSRSTPRPSTLGVEAVRVPPDAQEHLLRHVLGRGAIREVPERLAEHGAREQIAESREGTLVAGGDACEQGVGARSMGTSERATRTKPQAPATRSRLAPIAIDQAASPTTSTSAPIDERRRRRGDARRRGSVNTSPVATGRTAASPPR